jgi:DNA-binding response OmpR family regulator
MVTTLREREVFLLQPGRQGPEPENKPGKPNSFILVVEDDPPTLRLERVIMEEEGYRVEVAGSGEAALDFLNDNGSSPSLVLLDIGLPGMDGFATCARIREISQVPIIMVTGRNCLDDKVKGMNGGADDYVTKPFLTHELATRVKVVLRRAKKSGSEPQEIQEDVQEDIEGSSALPQSTPEPPRKADRFDADRIKAEQVEAGQTAAPASPDSTAAAETPIPAGRSYEGTVRLTITTLGPVRNLINFVSDLRQSSKFRLLRLVANQRTEGMDIWLGLRGPLPLVEILTEIHGVHSVVPGNIPDKETADQLLMVTLD